MVFAVLVLASCTPKKDSSFEDDPVDAATRRMDQGDVDGAIADLELLNQFDRRPRVSETLASAYANRAGLQVDRYLGFLSSFRAPDAGKSIRETRAQLALQDSLARFPQTEAAKRVRHLSELVASFELWDARMQELPEVSAEGRADLEKAIESLDRAPTRGGRLYRALLGLTALKADLGRGFEGWNRIEEKLSGLDLDRPASKENRDILCAVDVKSFARWSAQVIRRLQMTAEDLGRAYPSKEDSMKDAVEATRVFSNQLKKASEGSCS